VSDWTKKSIWSLAVLGTLAACEPAEPPARSREETFPSPTIVGERCARMPPPFRATYLPRGFDSKLRGGAGLFRGTGHPREGLLGHYLGPRATTHVNFQVAGGPLPYEPVNVRRTPVLGRRGVIGSIEGGYAVRFSVKGCDFRMDAYGISRRATIAVARGLTPWSQAAQRCPSGAQFEPTYLPDGFSRAVLPGPAREGRPYDRDGQVVVHYRGPGGRAIEIRRPGTSFTELARSGDAPTIEVLGAETTGFGPIEPGGDDFIVQFTYPTGAPSTDHCAIYSLNEKGLSLEELKRVAEGLRPEQ
jgi:hypothetical protein